MSETDGVPRFRSPRRRPVSVAVIATALILTAVTSCAGAGVAPNSASSASVVPGAAPSLGQASQGALRISGVSIKRQGTNLLITASIHNSGAADTLEQIGSQVSPTIALPVPVPAGGTVTLGGSGTNAVLDQQGRLEPGATVDLTFQFKNGGLLQVFSSFTDAASQ